MTTSLFEIGIDDNWHFIVNASPYFFLSFLAIGIFWIAPFRFLRNFIHGDVQLNVSLGGSGSVSITPNYEVEQIAHQAWAELATRKAGIPVDLDHDLIIEIYDSWYQLFSKLREMIKAVPAKQLKNEDTKKLIDLLVTSMNKGLRPHLTQWQAKFRRWYERALQKEEHKELSPQEIQKSYPEYQSLKDDMLRINRELVEYTQELGKLF